MIKLFRRRRLIVNITCPHGEFIPATYEMGQNRKLSCDKCGFLVRLTWSRRPSDA